MLQLIPKTFVIFFYFFHRHRFRSSSLLLLSNHSISRNNLTLKCLCGCNDVTKVARKRIYENYSYDIFKLASKALSTILEIHFSKTDFARAGEYTPYVSRHLHFFPLYCSSYKPHAFLQDMYLQWNTWNMFSSSVESSKWRSSECDAQDIPSPLTKYSFLSKDFVFFFPKSEQPHYFSVLISLSFFFFWLCIVTPTNSAVYTGSNCWFLHVGRELLVTLLYCQRLQTVTVSKISAWEYVITGKNTL